MQVATDNLVGLTGSALIDDLVWNATRQFGSGSHTLAYSLSLNDNTNAST